MSTCGDPGQIGLRRTVAGIDSASSCITRPICSNASLGSSTVSCITSCNLLCSDVHRQRIGFGHKYWQRLHKRITS